MVRHVVRVSSPEVAEACKILENTYRCVNIALVNELKGVFTAMGIDVWEVIAAAKTKPFGFLPFYPGPGVGGHCIPVYPHFLLSRAPELTLVARSREVNDGQIHVALEAVRVMGQRGNPSFVPRLEKLLSEE